MAKYYWGADSLFPCHTTKPGGYPLNKTIFDIVVAENRKPEFWGRYIVGKKEHILTTEEADFLLENKCRIMPIYNDLTPSGVGNATRDIGKRDAEKAIIAANNLNIPRWTYIFANLEWNFYPTADWFLGWWETMFNSTFGGVGGFYCTPTNSIFLNRFEKALKKAEYPGPIPNIKNLCPIFSSSSNGRGTQCVKGSKIPPWAPDQLPFNLGSTHFWQYQINCHKVQNKWGAYDKNLATEKGFRMLWSKKKK